MNRWAFQFFSPVILLCLLLIDGQMSRFFAEIFQYEILPIVHLTLIFLIYSVKKHSLTYLLVLGVLLGIIYDSYFLGVVGIATAVLPLIFLFVNEIQTIVFTNRWTKLFTTIIIVFIFELAVYLMQYAFQIVSVNVLVFIVKQLAATLVLNIFLMLLLEKPLEYFYRDKGLKIVKF